MDSYWADLSVRIVPIILAISHNDRSISFCQILYRYQCHVCSHVMCHVESSVTCYQPSENVQVYVTKAISAWEVSSYTILPFYSSPVTQNRVPHSIDWVCVPFGCILTSIIHYCVTMESLGLMLRNPMTVTSDVIWSTLNWCWKLKTQASFYFWCFHKVHKSSVVMRSLACQS